MLSIINSSKCFITPSTSPLDLAAYYCDTNIVLIDDLQNKNSFVSKILEINNKKSFCLSNNNFIEFEKFIDSL
jgi:ADP-heptose:LPS heptosyltransferase